MQPKSVVVNTPAATCQDPHSFCGPDDAAPPEPRKRSRSSTPLKDETHSHSVDSAVTTAGQELDNESAWVDAKSSFASSQWRRGAFQLPFDGTSFSPPAALLQRRKANRVETANSAPAGESGSTRATSSKAQAANYIAPNPWKLLAAIESSNSVSYPAIKSEASDWRGGAAVSYSCASDADVAPVLLSPEKWNAYWEAYSTCCAEELEDLAAQLKRPTTNYRRVLLTLVSTAVVLPLPSENRGGVLDALPSTELPGSEVDKLYSGSANLPARFSSTVSSVSSTAPAIREVDDRHSAAEDGKLDPASHVDSRSVSHSRPLSPSPAHESNGNGTGEPSSHSRATSSASSSYSYSSYSSYSSYTSTADTLSTSEEEDKNAMQFPALATVLDDLIYAHAHRFGAVEFMETRHSSVNGKTHTFVSVQFTSDEAAGLLYRWADSLSVEELVRSYWQRRVQQRRDGQQTSAAVRKAVCHPAADEAQNRGGNEETDGTRSISLYKANTTSTEDAWWKAFLAKVSTGQLELIAKLAPHDPRRCTSKLFLGPNVLVSTPLVNSLFTGLFCATRVEYDRFKKGFTIFFTDADECRLALHALQCSLSGIFNAPLIYA